MHDIDYIGIFASVVIGISAMALFLGILLDDWIDSKISRWQEKRGKLPPCRKVRAVRRAAADARLATYRKR